MQPDSAVSDENLSDLSYTKNIMPHIENDEGDLKYNVLEKLKLLLGKEGFKELVDSYVSRAKNHIQLARQCIETGDMEQLHFVAHTLKGSSANLGANNLAELSFSLGELALQTKSIDELYRQLTLIEKQFAKIESLLLEGLNPRIS